jgi:peroxiredoxin
MACREELPHLIALYKKHRAEGLQVVLITNEDAAMARRYEKEQALPFPVLIDANGSVAGQFQVENLPVTVALDKQGRAAGMAQGYSEGLFSQIEMLTAQLLKE